MLLIAGRAAVWLPDSPQQQTRCAAPCVGRMMARTDGQTDGRTLDNLIDPAPHAMLLQLIISTRQIIRKQILFSLLSKEKLVVVCHVSTLCSLLH